MRQKDAPDPEEDAIYGAILGRVIQARISMDYTQEGFADALDVKVDTYKKYEQRKRKLPYKTLLRVSTITDASMDWLFKGKGAGPKKVVRERPRRGRRTSIKSDPPTIPAKQRTAR